VPTRAVYRLIEDPIARSLAYSRFAPVLIRILDKENKDWAVCCTEEFQIRKDYVLRTL